MRHDWGCLIRQRVGVSSSRSRGCCAPIAIKTAAFYLEAALRAIHISPLLAMPKRIGKLLKNAILAKQEFDSIMQE